MEGCSKYCTYCVVPYTRGEEVSRPFEDVLTEVAGLVQQGVQEIHLLGQNVNAYKSVITGTDEVADLAMLLEYIADIPGVERLRFTTSHPKEFTQRLIDAYAKIPQLVSHLHLPVQHGSDRVLANMKRGYTVLEYKSVVRKLKAVRPDLVLSSDFIVGFPGETEEDFQQLMKLVSELKFDNSYCFIYSERPGTPAANLQDDTPKDVKNRRLRELVAKIDEHVIEINQKMVGTTEKVMIESVSRDGLHIQGRTANSRVVLVPMESNQAKRLIGKLMLVKITEAMPHSLRGEFIIQE
jgi:tRNA-2-methylthio-N6-dimethylallyladenosine synthase